MARMSWNEACSLDRFIVVVESLLRYAPDYAQTLTGG